MRIDLHTHSNFSDGTDTPAELVAKADQVLDVVALCDHDTFDGLFLAARAAAKLSVKLVDGIEISAGVQGRSVHLLGYFCDPELPGLAAELSRIRAARQDRIPEMLAALARLGYPISLDELLVESAASLSASGQGKSDGLPVLGRPHIADALVRRRVVADRREAFERFLARGKPAYVPRYLCPVEDAISLVLAASGVPILAHPWGRDSADLLPVAKLADLIVSHGLAGLEVDHQDHDELARGRLRALADELGVIVTGSSDYHGVGKINHDLGCNQTEVEMFERILSQADVG